MIIESKHVLETEPHRFTAEASDLRWRGFPGLVVTTLGNGQDFERVSIERRDGDLLWATYRQRHGCITLQVFND